MCVPPAIHNKDLKLQWKLRGKKSKFCWTIDPKRNIPKYKECDISAVVMKGD